MSQINDKVRWFPYWMDRASATKAHEGCFVRCDVDDPDATSWSIRYIVDGSSQKMMGDAEFASKTELYFAIGLMKHAYNLGQQDAKNEIKSVLGIPL